MTGIHRLTLGVLGVLLCGTIAAAGEDLTIQGTTYRDATWKKTEANRVKIYHRAGIAEFSLDALPADLQQKFGYTPQPAETPAKAAPVPAPPLSQAEIQQKLLAALLAKDDNLMERCFKLSRELEGDARRTIVTTALDAAEQGNLARAVKIARAYVASPAKDQTAADLAEGMDKIAHNEIVRRKMLTNAAQLEQQGANAQRMAQAAGATVQGGIGGQSQLGVTLQNPQQQAANAKQMLEAAQKVKSQAQEIPPLPEQVAALRERLLAGMRNAEERTR